MARLTDPDQLGQGASTALSNFSVGSVSGANCTISATTLTGIEQYEYFEIRGATNAENNGLYVATAASAANAVTVTKVAGDGINTPSSETNSSGVSLIGNDETGSPAQLKTVYFDWYNREIWLLKQQDSGATNGLSNDGVTLQALYSFTKEEWKNDDELIRHPFPFVAVTPEQMELVEGWVFHVGTDAGGIGASDTVQDTQTSKLIRSGGWREIDAASILQKEYAGVVTLGDFENNTADVAYFEQGNDPATADTTDFTFAGPVNEAVVTYDYMPSALGTVTIASNNAISRTTGSWITDGYKKGGQITVIASDTAGDLGTYVISTITASTLTVTGTPLTDEGSSNVTFASAVNNRNVLNVRIRVRDAGDTNGSTFDSSNLSAIGVTAVDNKVFRFPLSSASDLDILVKDANINQAPYTDIAIRFFDGTFSQEIETGVTSNFSIVVDVGTYSGIDGVSNGTTSFTTPDAGIPGTTFDGGTLVIHEGSGKGEYAISTASGGTVTLATGTPAADTGASFTLKPATPSTATLKNIYEKIQYELRLDTDINDHATTAAVIGKKADALLRFLGTELESGQGIPTNPYDSGNGVAILGFRAADVNEVAFFDNTGAKKTFPFEATFTINFNPNLVADSGNISEGKFWVFFDRSVRTTGTDIEIGSISGRSATITGASSLTVLGGSSPEDLLDQEYFRLSGCSNSENNGIYRATDVSGLAGSGAVVAYKVSGAAPVAESSGASISLDQNPIDSDNALLVQDNSTVPADITGFIPVSGTQSFTFDYTNNVQGGRTPATDAPIVIRAIGTFDAQFVEASATIEANTTQAFTLTAAKERNYAT